MFDDEFDWHEADPADRRRALRELRAAIGIGLVVAAIGLALVPSIARYLDMWEAASVSMTDPDRPLSP